MSFEKFPAAVDAGRFIFGVRLPGLAGQSVQDAEYLVEVGQHVRFGASERGQADFGQPFLQRAPVALAQPQVMDKIAGARLVAWIDARQKGRKTCFIGQHFPAQVPQLIDDGSAGGFIPGVNATFIHQRRRGAGFSCGARRALRFIPGDSGGLGLEVIFFQRIFSPERLPTARRQDNDHRPDTIRRLCDRNVAGSAGRRTDQGAPRRVAGWRVTVWFSGVLQG